MRIRSQRRPAARIEAMKRGSVLLNLALTIERRSRVAVHDVLADVLRVVRDEGLLRVPRRVYGVRSTPLRAARP